MVWRQPGDNFADFYIQTTRPHNLILVCITNGAAAELQFRTACKEALADGKLTVDEKHELKMLAESLKMSNEAMKQILEDEVKIFQASQKVAPTQNVELQFRRACKKVLADGKVTPDEERQLKSLAKFFKMSNETMKQILKDW